MNSIPGREMHFHMLVFLMKFKLLGCIQATLPSTLGQLLGKGALVVTHVWAVITEKIRFCS